MDHFEKQSKNVRCTVYVSYKSYSYLTSIGDGDDLRLQNLLQFAAQPCLDLYQPAYPLPDTWVPSQNAGAAGGKRDSVLGSPHNLGVTKKLYD